MTWTQEGRERIAKSLRKAHEDEIREALRGPDAVGLYMDPEWEEYNPSSALYSDESRRVLEDTYFDLHTYAGPF